MLAMRVDRYALDECREHRRGLGTDSHIVQGRPERGDLLAETLQQNRMRQDIRGFARRRTGSVSRQPREFRLAVRDHVHQDGTNEATEKILRKVGKLHLELLTPDLPGFVRVAIQSDQPRCLSLKLLDEDPGVFLRKEMALQDGEGRRLDGFLANGNRVRAGATFLLAGAPIIVLAAYRVARPADRTSDKAR
ncbi:hypothetical protein [Sphingomonas sp. PAMC26645]|uniref:hypothetical protein n=1 Tax=Sphingomonas sp. PAMC26645 TaxID=2565555 RepID=UPI001FF9E668|nr:hypothetical protein [Sphingomonas sp. PAMC26645]